MNLRDAIEHLAAATRRGVATPEEAVRLQALALVAIAEHLENISALLATGLGNGSPLVEALRERARSGLPVDGGRL